MTIGELTDVVIYEEGEGSRSAGERWEMGVRVGVKDTHVSLSHPQKHASCPPIPHSQSMKGNSVPRPKTMALRLRYCDTSPRPLKACKRRSQRTSPHPTLSRPVRRPFAGRFDLTRLSDCCSLGGSGRVHWLRMAPYRRRIISAVSENPFTLLPPQHTRPCTQIISCRLL